MQNRKFIGSVPDDQDQAEKSGILENIAVMIVFLSVFGFFIKIIFF